MTVKELISLLEQLPEDRQVFVRSYEDGYDPIDSIASKQLHPDTSECWYNGRFNVSCEPQEKDSFEGVVIIGDQRSP